MPQVHGWEGASQQQQAGCSAGLEHAGLCATRTTSGSGCCLMLPSPVASGEAFPVLQPVVGLPLALC